MKQTRGAKCILLAGLFAASVTAGRASDWRTSSAAGTSGDGVFVTFDAGAKWVRK
jgi:hypothetical protein